MKKLIQLIIITSALIFNINVYAENEKSITVASTTSTENSGLFKYIIPKFTEKYGIKVKIIVQGTGQAIKTARNGDADVLLVHHTPSEIKFVQDGFATKRFNLMYNDFVLIGSNNDPAKITKSSNNNVKLAFKRIYEINSEFTSRGDESGTHKKELSIWNSIGLSPLNKPWYFESGSSMGNTINMAIAKNAYTLTDRATWISFKNKQDFKIVLQGDKALFNQYGVMIVSDKKYKHIKTKLAKQFVDWLLSPEGQNIINSYKMNGQQLFFANYK